MVGLDAAAGKEQEWKQTAVNTAANLSYDFLEKIGHAHVVGAYVGHRVY